MGGRIVMAAMAAMVSVLVPVSAMASGSSPTRNPVSQSPAPRVAPVAATMASDRVMGRADAPITIIEYASFTCPHCATFNSDVLPELKRLYIDTGKAKLIFRDLPTAPVQVSASLAAMARCAAPNRFFTVTDHLMRGQEAAFRSNDIAGWMRGAIPQTGRTEAQLLECMNSQTTRDTLNADVDAAQASGITGTPALFVNGRRVAIPTLEGMVDAISPLLP